MARRPLLGRIWENIPFGRRTDLRTLTTKLIRCLLASSYLLLCFLYVAKENLTATSKPCYSGEHFKSPKTTIGWQPFPERYGWWKWVLTHSHLTAKETRPGPPSNGYGAQADLMTGIASFLWTLGRQRSW